MSYRVRLSKFEGPFDLLVYLIEHARMSIYDIRIAEITDQYIDYVNTMKEANVELASEFMVLAAELLEIKSKMLLPRTRPDKTGNEVYEDPRSELAERLAEYKKYREIASMLEERYARTSESMEKPQEDLAQYTGEPDEYLNLDITKFMEAFRTFLTRKRRLDEIRTHYVRTEKQRITTERRIDDIKSFFIKNSIPETSFANLVHDKDDKYDISVTFSSVLEMMKEKKLDAEQKKLFGEIRVIAADSLFADEETDNTEYEETAAGDGHAKS